MSSCLSRICSRPAFGGLLAALVFALPGCGRQGGAVTPAAAPAPEPLSVMAQVGRKLFFEPSLSASGKQSCASCHDPAHAFAPANALAVQFGGPDLNLQGERAVPKLTYLIETPGFSVGPDDTGGLELHPSGISPHAGPQAGTLAAAAAPGPARLARVAPSVSKSSSAAAAAVAMVPQGGLFWDGRVDTLQGQALAPLLNPLEMGNKSAAEIVAKLRKLDVVEQLKLLAGPNVETDDKLLLS